MALADEITPRYDFRMNRLLTPKEAADILRICERSLRKLRQQGQIPYVSFGVRKVFYRAEDVEAFIEANTKLVPAERFRLPKRVREVSAVFDIEDLRTERDARQRAKKGARPR